jgi:hypothetical protein
MIDNFPPWDSIVEGLMESPQRFSQLRIDGLRYHDKRLT